MSKQNLTRIVGIGWGLMLFALIGILYAQDIPIERDTPVTVTIGDSPAWLTYNGQAGETITLSTLTAITDTAPDTTLEILYPDGHRMDYVDDVVFPDGTVKSDAVLQNLTLPIDGTYRIRVDSFNGVSEGEVEVLLTYPDDNYNVISTDTLTIVSGEIDHELTYTLDVPADVGLRIVARDVSGTLDPILMVYDESNTLLAFNDDHDSDDLSLDVFDAQLMDVSVTAGSQLSIVVRDYMGRSGTIELIISS